MPTEPGATGPVSVESGAEAAELLVRRLTGGGLYVKTGVLLLPRPWLGREGEVAARLNLGRLDFQHWRAARLKPGERFLRYTAERLLAELDEVCKERHQAEHLLIANLDLPVAALNGEERKKFWDFLNNAFSKRSRALLITFPAQATELLPWETDLKHWKDQGRLAPWEL